jgi:hypothetical protein
MSGDRLDRGFITWQGRRVFVPWLGAPRIVPSAEDEVRVLKIRFRLDWVLAVTVVPFLVAGAWIANGATLLALISGLLAVFGAGFLIERRRIRAWPRLINARFARTLFLRHYFRGLPLGERVSALCWSGLGALIAIQGLSDLVPILIEAWDDPWSVAWLAGILASLLMLGFLTLRHFAIVLLSLKSADRRAADAASMRAQHPAQ